MRIHSQNGGETEIDIRWNHCFAPNWSNHFEIFSQVSEDGGVWTIKTSTTLKTMELKFKVCSPHTTKQVEHFNPD